MLSGRDWVRRFPTSTLTQDLAVGFKDRVEKFIGALTAGGATVHINATLRPPERAYLMHYAWRIAKEKMDPLQVPNMNRVDIQWSHLDDKGELNLNASRLAAEQMVRDFGIVFKPSLKSRHTQGGAIDMRIEQYLNKSFNNASNRSTTITSDAGLHRLGASYGVYKLASAPPHWSDDGR
ncbi:hypothetical protein PSQ20_13465 [Curvibacter sp. RS43]|uniref:hypothetical protein n=1 Tax=Curvibacter microcysteis TaxID=3026419 RepID=UPI00235EA257|nr:hypothetical protein [Curvibacter sp. RS43]MDD0811358.1 hypothetical protein [Curvibacter sp. RS43]